MGYTHYFEQNTIKKPDDFDQNWEKFISAVKLLLTRKAVNNNLPQVPLSPVEITDSSVLFNGADSNGAEDFWIKRPSFLLEGGFEFCKTHLRPYDVYVAAALILLDHYCPEVWKISTDGGYEDYLPAVELLVQAKLLCPYEARHSATKITQTA